MAIRFSPGCPECVTPQCGTIVVNVRGCMGAAAGGALAGATVVLKLGGTTLDTQVTPAGGQVTFPITSAASYTVEVTPPAGAGFATPAAQTFAALCAGSSVNTRTFTLTADANHVCCTTLCNFPIPKSLSISDGIGSVALAYDAGLGGWHGCALRTANAIPAEFFNAYAGGPAGGGGSQNCNLTSVASITTPVGFMWLCSGLTIGVMLCAGAGLLAGTCYVGTPATWPPTMVPPAGTNTGFGSGVSQSGVNVAGTTTLSSCDPLAWSTSKTLSSGTGLSDRILRSIYGTTGTVTFTTTE
jgi:hypothetical protein